MQRMSEGRAVQELVVSAHGATVRSITGGTSTGAWHAKATSGTRKHRIGVQHGETMPLVLPELQQVRKLRHAPTDGVSEERSA